MTTSPSSEMKVELDIIGQIPAQIYTQISLIYPVQIATAYYGAVDKLQNGLERLAQNFPWTAGQVIIDGATPGNTGVASIRPFRKTPTLVIRDERDHPEAPSMDALRKNGFPIGSLHESLVAPRTTLPEENGPSEAPALYVQATFIRGGMILTFVAHHCVMDIIGQASVMALLSKACRGEEFTAEEIRTGNMDRRHVVPFLDDYKPGPEVAHQLVRPPIKSTKSREIVGPPAPVPCGWANFSFPAVGLTALKAEANQSLKKGFASTDDALTALLWQSITRARLPRFRESHPSTVKFARAVDVRAALDIPARYPGWIQNMTYHHFPPHKLAEAPLGEVAAELRGALDSEDLRFRSRALATVLRDAADKTRITLTASLDLENDLMLSSWAKVDCFTGMDFGFGLGEPEAVRRPGFTPVESLVYLGPKAPDGEVVAVVCLRDEDMERLKEDEEFGKYAKYIG